MSLQVESMPAGQTASLDLEGKVAVITGAARGIGRAIAEALAAQGATVVISDVTQDAARATAAEIDGADAAACDVSDEAQVAELFAGTLSRHGRLDIAVANAGISGLGPRGTVQPCNGAAIASGTRHHRSDELSRRLRRARSTFAIRRDD
jgi:NAD(P)-dependent dehydrogenase (short-subunit alcohol dehydrogenase family)